MATGYLQRDGRPAWVLRALELEPYEPAPVGHKPAQRICARCRLPAAKDRVLCLKHLKLARAKNGTYQAKAKRAARMLRAANIIKGLCPCGATPLRNGLCRGCLESGIRKYVHG